MHLFFRVIIGTSLAIISAFNTVIIFKIIFMKKVILSAFALISCVGASYAQTAAVVAAPQPSAQAVASAAAQHGAAEVSTATDDKTKVEATALPDAVKASLAGDDYKGWTVSNAWQAKDGSYVIELKKENETTTIKMDKGGKKIG